MYCDMVKYERGQIWMIRFKYPEQVGHEIQKDRPWLILSVGRYNMSSGMITAVPITTRDKVRTPSQVLFVNSYKDNNVILCEGIRSFDFRSGNYILDYIGTVSDEVLEKVDVALSIHLGLHYSPITLDRLHKAVEAVITSVGHMQKEASTPKFTDDDVLEFAVKLQSLAEQEQTSNEVSAPVEESPDTADDTEVVATPVEVTIEDTPKTPAPVQKPARIRWTKEKCEEFLADVDELPMKKVMEKWNISKKTRFYSMKNYTQSLLMKATQ